MGANSGPIPIVIVIVIVIVIGWEWLFSSFLHGLMLSFGTCFCLKSGWSDSKKARKWGILIGAMCAFFGCFDWKKMCIFCCFDWKNLWINFLYLLLHLNLLVPIYMTPFLWLFTYFIKFAYFWAVFCQNMRWNGIFFIVFAGCRAVVWHVFWLNPNRSLGRKALRNHFVLSFSCHSGIFFGILLTKSSRRSPLRLHWFRQ